MTKVRRETMTITIDGTRYDLSGMIELHFTTRESGGHKYTNAWFGPRSHRIIVETYSIWTDRSSPGACIGTRYYVYEPGSDAYNQMVQIIEEADIPLPDAPVPTITEPDHRCSTEVGHPN